MVLVASYSLINQFTEGSGVLWGLCSGGARQDKWPPCSTACVGSLANQLRKRIFLAHPSRMFQHTSKCMGVKEKLRLHMLWDPPEKRPSWIMSLGGRRACHQPLRSTLCMVDVIGLLVCSDLGMVCWVWTSFFKLRLHFLRSEWVFCLSLNSKEWQIVALLPFIRCGTIVFSGQVLIG